jgi:predicted HicB family RNase H-like nuclease
MPETVVHFQIRMPPVLHEKMASWAKDDKASLNGLVVEVLQNAMKVHESDDKKKKQAGARQESSG